MEFFKTLAELTSDKLQLGVAITIENGVAVLTVTPRTTRDNKSWSPFVLRGTPDELDAAFEQALADFRDAVEYISESQTYKEKIEAEAAARKEPPKEQTPTRQPAKKAAAPAKPAPAKAAPTPLSPEARPPVEEEEQPALFD